MNKNAYNMNNLSSETELSNREDLLRLFESSPIPKEELISNLPLFINRQNLSRLFFFKEIYEKIVNIHGVVIEFGVRWGANLGLFQSLRGMYEPFNHNRKIIGFDTFEGFPSVHEKDGKSEVIKKGGHGVIPNYEKYLDKILSYHEKESPIAHLKKYAIIKGNAVVEIHKYLEENPETIIALAYFDFDIYEPTLECLKAIAPHLTKGSVLGFDELNLHNFPGETLALKEILGLDKYSIRRTA